MYMYRGVFVYEHADKNILFLLVGRGFTISRNRYINVPLPVFTRTQTAIPLSKKMSDCGSLGYRLGYQHQKG